jgi:alkanesulfonate monooxygenase SsuD/methylene tetrahydromethanopterin reductase-like flavin-dependent oxidoreductase (luciferase family)
LETQKNFDLYREIAANDGYEASPQQMGWAVPTYVAETDEIARRELKPHVEAFFNRFLRFPLEMRLPPGYSSVASTKHLIETKFAVRSTDQTIDSLIELGMVVCGSAATVRDTFLHRQKTMGFGNLIAMMQIATQPAEQTEKSLRLFASDVAPHLRSVAV